MPACLCACVPAWCARERILKKKKNALRVSPLSSFFFRFPKKKRKESTKKKYLDHTHGVPSSHIKRALQCACTYLLRVKMATSSAFIVQPNFLIKRNVFTVRFFTPARINRNFSCHRFNPFFVCGDASNFHTYKLTLTFISLSLSLSLSVCVSVSLSFRTFITTHVGV